MQKKITIEIEVSGDTEGLEEALKYGIEVFFFSRPYKLESFEMTTSEIEEGEG